MNWTVPPLLDSPTPAAPHALRWGIALLIMLVAGFFLAVYLLSPEELRDKQQLMLMALGTPLLFWGLLLGGRLVVYGLQSARVNARNQLCAQRRAQWRYWANQRLNLLAWSRQTALGPKDHALMMSEQPPVNQGNRLVFSEFAGLPLWESRSQLIARLLQPVNEFVQAHPNAVPLRIRWQVTPTALNELDWAQLLEQETQRLALPVTDIAQLEQRDVTTWLLTAYDQPLNGLLCLLFIDASDTSSASEEAVSLLLASDELCQQIKCSTAAHLLRPLLTPVNTLPQAMQQLCEQQCPATKISAGWQGALSGVLQEKIPLACAELGITFPARQQFDTDSALGVPGIARYATQLTLAAEHKGNNLLFTAHQGQCLLQQLRYSSGSLS